MAQSDAADKVSENNTNLQLKEFLLTLVSLNKMCLWLCEKKKKKIKKCDCVLKCLEIAKCARPIRKVVIENILG